MPILETTRLLLRPVTSADLDGFAAMNADPDVMRYIGEGKPQTREQTHLCIYTILEHWEQHGFGLYTIVDKVTRAYIGFCGLQYLDNTSEIEIGYRLAQQFWGTGLATEAAKASLRQGFDEFGLNRIVAVVQPGNLASQRVVEKIGLRYVKDARFYKTDVKYYAITREEYQSL